MTPQQFLKDHGNGDYTTWEDTAFELYGHVATPGGKPVPDEVIAFNKQPPLKALTTADPGLEKHLAEASLLPTPRTTQPTA